MTRSEALRALVTKRRDHVDQGRIGKRVIFAEADAEKLRIPLVYRVMRFQRRKAS